MSRPEHLAPPEIFYNEDEAKKYTQNSRIIEIQEQMSERAIELLILPESSSNFILDIGCGSGLSGSVLEENGHFWVGMDISTAMLDIALEREVEGDLILSDIGQGCPFKAGAFDGAISISALQWLCNADKSHHKPVQRLYKFFSTLYACLSRSARAVLQFYPENGEQMELVTSQAMKAGFYGGVVVDYPNSTKAKKFFLVLMTGGNVPLPKGLGNEGRESEEWERIRNPNLYENQSGQLHIRPLFFICLLDPEKVPKINKGIDYAKREKIKNQRGKPMKSVKQWILDKKERRRKQGKEVPHNSKYTGRKRSGRF